MSELALMISVVAAQNSAAPTIIRSPMAWRGSSAGVGRPKATTMPAKDKRETEPLRRAETVGGQEDARAEHDEERREIDEQHRAHRRGVGEALEDQNEFDAEEETGGKPGAQRAVAREQRNAAQPAPAGDDQRRGDGTDGRLDQRRDVVDRELHRHLVEAPGQAQHHHDRGGDRIERAGDGT